MEETIETPWSSGKSVEIPMHRGRWFEPGVRRRVVSLDKVLYSTVAQVYKWVLTIIILGGEGGGYPCDGLASHSGGVAIFLAIVTSCYRNRSETPA